MRVHWKIIVLIVGVAVIAFFAGYYVGGMVETDLQKNESPDLYLPITNHNPHTWEEEVHFYVRVPGDLPLKGKLDNLADQLSQLRFGGLPIEVKAIEMKDSRSIAIINLREDGRERWGWKGGYFEGSSGGHSTSIELIHNFLQYDYDGEWIEGVWFYYEGKPVSEYFGGDHIPLLYDITWRDSL